jgi:archaeal flagellin FlaB
VKEVKSMKGDSSKGMMGIGALIIFIAIILIAAVAASVLITTGGSLQQKALITGAQTEESIASGVEAMTVVASDASSAGTPHRIDNFKILARLQSGSTGMNLNNTIMTVDTETTSVSFTYNETVSQDTITDSTTSYLVYYVQTGINHEDGYINRGDVAKLIFHSGSMIGENELVRIKIIPRVGTYTQIEFYTPDSMTQQTVALWPT